MKMRAHLSLLALLTTVALDVSAQGMSYRPGREFRSLNTDAYEISVQRNGRLDVVLANGESVFTNAFPMVWFDQEKKPELMTVDGRWSQRFEVNNRLGRGQGMMLKKDECEWLLHAYPSKPYFAVQLAYTNNTKKPVTIKALMPFCVGDPKKGTLSLGEDTLASLSKENAIAIQAASAEGLPYTPSSLAILNPKTGRVMLAGFLSDQAALTSFTVSQEESRKKKNDAPNTTFRGICIFDPPVVLEPGQRLESDVLYLALAETYPHTALERFALAAISANELRHEPGLVPYQWLPEFERPHLKELTALESAMERPAIPVDLFEADKPRMWFLPLGIRPDQGHAVALFNWNESRSEQFQLPFGSAGLDHRAHYAVYDLLQNTYYGNAAEELTVPVPAGGARLLALRKVTNRPMLLSIPPAAAQTKRDQWDAANSRLSGTLESGTGKEHTLRILVPSPYTVKEVTANSDQLEWKIEENILTFSISENTQASVEWIVQF